MIMSVNVLGLSKEISNYLEKLSSGQSNDATAAAVTTHLQNNFYLVTSQSPSAAWSTQIPITIGNILFGEASPLKTNYFYDLVGANDNKILKNCLELIQYFTSTFNQKGEVIKRLHVQVDVVKKNSVLIEAAISLLGFDESSFTYQNNNYEDVYQPLLFQIEKTHPILKNPKERYQKLMKELISNNINTIITQSLKGILLLSKLNAVESGRSYQIENQHVLEEFEDLMGLNKGRMAKLLETYKSKRQFDYEIPRLLAEIYHSTLNFLVKSLNTILEKKCIDYNPFVVKDPESVLKSSVMGKMFIHEVVMSSLITKLGLTNNDITEVNASNLLLFQKLLECEQNPVSLSSFCSTNSTMSTTLLTDMFSLTVKHSYGVHNVVHYDFFDSLVYESNCDYKSIMHHLQVPILTQYYTDKWTCLGNDFKSIKESIDTANNVCVLVVQLAKNSDIQVEKEYLYNQLCSIGVSECLEKLSQGGGTTNNRGRDDTFTPPTTTTIITKPLPPIPTPKEIIQKEEVSEDIINEDSPPDYYTATKDDIVEEQGHHSIEMTQFGTVRSSKAISPPQVKVFIYEQFRHNIYTKDNQLLQAFTSTIYRHDHDPYNPLDNGIVFGFNEQIRLLFDSDQYEYDYDLLEILYGYQIALSTDQALFQFDDNRYTRIKVLLQSRIFNVLVSFLQQYAKLKDVDEYGAGYNQVIGSMANIVFLSIENMSIYANSRGKKLKDDLVLFINSLYPLLSHPVCSAKCLASFASSIIHLTSPGVKQKIVNELINKKLVTVLVDSIDPLNEQKSRQIILILFIICRLPNRFKHVAQHLYQKNRGHLVIPFRRLLQSKKLDNLSELLDANQVWDVTKFNNNHSGGMEDTTTTNSLSDDQYGDDDYIDEDEDMDSEEEEYEYNYNNQDDGDDGYIVGESEGGYLEFDDDDDDDDSEEEYVLEYDDDEDEDEEEEEFDDTPDQRCFSFSS
ncbi:hypothetical protein DFA_03285 [Cavenderia fasciculata]|uniref:Uncharacterized protein n=1 Tax=Cavenderia fasciculata TaxID=261658 RepID=F4PH55_CACFS|nr:uncharacterized protein DFA_03285 [Cavenderia fasciculata]EGG25039.1 hypothetical protein DFA_03285 [Cavenderia fasciculata]|eukprot:XP_004362890.1 hypothetical protein DFA_03285 [Cavenderia fasciculata]